MIHFYVVGLNCSIKGGRIILENMRRRIQASPRNIFYASVDVSVLISAIYYNSSIFKIFLKKLSKLATAIKNIL